MMFDPNPLKFLENVSALNATSEEFAINAFDRLELIGDFKTGVTAGAFVLEVAPFKGYTGTWDTIATVTVSGTGPVTKRSSVENGSRIGRVRVSVAFVGGVGDAYVNRMITGKGEG
jgi:hypothetical protein